MYYFEESSAIHNPIRWPKPVVSSSSAQAIADLISRVLDGAPAAQLFQLSINPDLAVNDKDVFQLSDGSTPGSILISASSGVAAAWGFNHYLKYVANSSCMTYFLISFYLVIPILYVVYWSGKNIRLTGSTLIPLSAPIRIVANDFFRWYGNTCTFSYSAVFWNFSR